MKVFIILVVLYLVYLLLRKKKKVIVKSKKPNSTNTFETNISIDTLKQVVLKNKERVNNNIQLAKNNIEVIEKKTYYLLIFFNKLENAYSLSEVKKCVDIVCENFQFLLDVSETPTYIIDVKEGIKTYVITQKTDVNKKVIDCIDKPNNNDFYDLINLELLNVVKRIESKNNELIEKYKKEDKIKERYRVVYESSSNIDELVVSSNNQVDIIQEISLIKSRAYTRGQLHIS